MMTKMVLEYLKFVNLPDLGHEFEGLIDKKDYKGKEVKEIQQKSKKIR